MSEEPTLESSPDLPDHVDPERSAGSPSEQIERAANDGNGWRTRWKAKAARILPRRAPDPEDRLASPLPGIVMFLVLLGVTAASILLPSPPAPLPANAPADQYSAERALSHIQALAMQPRPVGTSAHAAAEAYLVTQLERLGLEPQIQKAVTVRYQMVAPVENVLARLPGSMGGGKAVLLMAHYDSVPSGPGASDDASGAATLLETARALKAGGRTVANDVIFLFSDKEEEYLMGAAAFVEEHPWAKDVGVVLNFDPDGLTGRPVSIDDISPNDGWLIAQYAAAALDPLASSIGPDVYRLLPTGSDLTVFKDAGYPGIEFGGNGGGAYHTVLDDPAHVSLGSLQHQGAYALSLARRFGDLDLTAAHRGDAVYFTVPGTHRLVHYPQSWIFPLVALAGLVTVGALVLGQRWQQVSTRGVLLGLLASIVVVGVLAGVGKLLWRLLVAVYPQYETWGGDTYNGVYYWLAFMALGVGLGALLHIVFRTRLRTADLAVGGLLLWLAGAVGLSAWMPGASYALTWSLVFGSLGVGGWFALRRRGASTAWRVAWLALFAIPALALVAPLLYEGYQGLSMQAAWVPMAVLGLLIGMLAPHLAVIARPRKWWLPTIMGIVAVVCLVAGHLTSSYTAERPLQDGVVYGSNADGDRAYWLSWGGLDAWTRQFFEEDDAQGDYREFFPDAYPAAYKAPAPPADVRPANVEQLDATAPGTFHVRVVPPPGAYTVHLFAMPYKTAVTYYVGDRPIEAEDGWMLYWTPPAEGFDVTVKAPGLDSLKLRVLAFTLGLPTIPGFTYAARPAWIIPSADTGQNSTWVAKTFAFGKE